MKIKKHSLNEQLLTEADDITNLETVSEEDLADEIKDSAEDAGIEISDKAAKEEAEEVDKFANLIYNPYGTAAPGDIEKLLQRAFHSALRQKRMGDQSDYPNILIYGQAGVGKSAIVSQFCKAHGLKMKYIKASTLSPEIIRGIPYPVRNDKTGGYSQVLVTDPSWDMLNEPCVIFCDEYNRANPKAADYLLGLINEHQLPTTIERKDGAGYDSTIFYPNILFTVAAINPRTKAFKKTVEPLDAAQMGRFAAVYKQEANTNDWGSYFVNQSRRISAGDFKKPQELKRDLKSLYSAILADPNLPAADAAVYEGQANIAQELMDNGLTFNTQQEIDDIYSLHDQEGQVYAYLSPRTLSMWIRMSDGTKKDFFDIISNSGLRDSDKRKIKNCLANYQDKATVGNNVFNNSGSQTNKTNAEQDLIDFINKL